MLTQNISTQILVLQGVFYTLNINNSIPKFAILFGRGGKELKKAGANIMIHKISPLFLLHTISMIVESNWKCAILESRKAKFGKENVFTGSQKQIGIEKYPYWKLV